MGTVVGVSTAGEASAVEVTVGKGATVSVGLIGAEVGGGEEQEMRRRIQKAERRTRYVMCWGIRIF